LTEYYNENARATLNCGCIQGDWQWEGFKEKREKFTLATWILSSMIKEAQGKAWSQLIGGGAIAGQVFCSEHLF
jgi:hypothetical protein